MKRTILLFLLILFFSTSVFGSEIVGRISLLAVTESTIIKDGSVLEAELKITPGSGAVYVDTFPYSKLDTVASIRFSKEIACNFLDLDCSNLDFHYRIKSNLPLSMEVGGPSAGSAFALLNILLLEDLKRGEQGIKDYRYIAMTGTINAGSYIGYVNGVEYKVKAAVKNHLKYVFIPDFTYEKDEYSDDKEYLNFTGCKNFGKTTVCKVNNLYEVLSHLNKLENKKEQFEQYQTKTIEVPQYYHEVMNEIAKKLCKRVEDLMINDFVINTSKEMNLTDRYEKGKLAAEQGNYYSAASLCLTSSIQIQKLSLYNEILFKINISNLSNETKSNLSLLIFEEIEKLKVKANELKENVTKFQKNIENLKAKSLGDFQTKLIVLERIDDALQNLKSIEEFSVNENSTFEENYLSYLMIIDKLGYAIERSFTVELWSMFFGKDKKEINLDLNKVKELCEQKLFEAKEVFYYINYYVPSFNESNTLSKAEEYMKNKDYVSCVYFSTRAKVELQSALVGSEDKNKTVEELLKLLKATLVEQADQGYFAILGYSYFEYANTLKNFDIDSAYSFAFQGIELSDLEMYFKTKKRENIMFYERNQYLNGFYNGFLLAILLITFIFLFAKLINFKNKENKFIKHQCIFQKILFNNKKWKKKKIPIFKKRR
ncbi:MAG: hypothetical protein QXS41_03085 [Candidatus Woesearchaeota archaeon]